MESKLQSDECPTKVLEKELLIPESLQVGTKEEIQEKTKEIQGRSKTVVKVALRAVGFNLDVIFLLLCCLSCIWLGYAICNVFGKNITQVELKTVKEISAAASDYLELIGIVVTVILTMLAKLAANRGLISERLNELLSNFLYETFKKKNEIDPKTYVTFIGDRK